MSTDEHAVPALSENASVRFSDSIAQTDLLSDNTKPILDLMAQLIESKAEFEKQLLALQTSKLNTEALLDDRPPQARQCNCHCSASL